MFVKIMSAEDAPDSDTRKTYTLFDDVSSVEFEREGDKAIARILFLDGSQEDFVCPGNVYVMNDQGKTVSAFGPMPLRGTTGLALPPNGAAYKAA